jgi:hypothetical protein
MPAHSISTACGENNTFVVYFDYLNINANECCMQSKDVFVECTGDYDVGQALDWIGNMKTKIKKGTPRFERGWRENFTTTLQYEKRANTYVVITPNGCQWELDTKKTPKPIGELEREWEEVLHATDYGVYSFTLSSPTASMVFTRPHDGTYKQTGNLISSTDGQIVSLKAQFTVASTLERMASVLG